MQAQDLAMGNIAIYQNNKLAYAHSFGYRSVIRRDFANPQTLYRIGQISEVYTATLILQLIQEKKLTNSTTLQPFFPGLPYASKITIKDLLMHHSGLPALPDSLKTLSHNFKEQFVQFLTQVEITPSPQPHYTAIDYILLAQIAEKIEHKKQEALFKKRIADSLHLVRTKFSSKINPNNNEAYPYILKNKIWQLAPTNNTLKNLNGALSGESSASELARFFTFIFNSSLWNEKSVNSSSLTTQLLNQWFTKEKFHQMSYYSWKSQFENFQIEIAYFPKDKTSAVICLNASKLNPEEITKAAMTAYFGYAD